MGCLLIFYLQGAEQKGECLLLKMNAYFSFLVVKKVEFQVQKMSAVNEGGPFVIILRKPWILCSMHAHLVI